MFCVGLKRPSDRLLDRRLRRWQGDDFTYAPPGCTLGHAPAGFDDDHYRVRLGSGEHVFREACRAVMTWKMIPQPWAQVAPAADQIAEGVTLAILIRAYGLWWTNAARVVYVTDEPGRRAGFAYGTLPGHIELGEERFMVERDEDGDVWYDLRAISRPRCWFLRLGYPLIRGLQRRFARDSQRSIVAAVDRRTSGSTK